MKVILTEDVKRVGRKGEVINTSDGHARNYLIPQGLAKPATPSQIKELEAKNEEEIAKDKERATLLEELQQRTEANPIEIPAKVGEGDKLFAAIKEADILPRLLEYEPRLKAEKVHLEAEKPIKTIEKHPVSIDLGRGVKDVFTVEVKPSN